MLPRDREKESLAGKRDWGLREHKRGEKTENESFAIGRSESKTVGPPGEEGKYRARNYMTGPVSTQEKDFRGNRKLSAFSIQGGVKLRKKNS